jgi:hypothetical protein
MAERPAQELQELLTQAVAVVAQMLTAVLCKAEQAVLELLFLVTQQITRLLLVQD